MPRLLLSYLSVLPVVLLALTFSATATASDGASDGASEGASDWLHFRGPEFDGTSTADWPDQPELEIAWKTPLGNGYSAIVVAGDRLYTGFGDDGSDWLGAFDADSGAELWRVRLGVEFPAFGGGHGGPSATPAVGAGLVFAVGGHGSMVAVRPDGEEVWRRDLTEWADSPPWGFASSPVLLADTVLLGDDDPILLIQTPGRDGKILFALDPATGDPIWSIGDDASGYQTPIRTRLAGRDQIVVSGISTLYGVSLEGEILWSFDNPPAPPAPKGVQSLVPLPIGGDRLLVEASSKEVLAVQVGPEPGCDASSQASGAACPLAAELVWSSPHFARSYVPSLHYQGIVYGYKGSLISALDAADGDLLWRARSPGDGFFAAADGRVAVLTKRGSLHLGRAGSDGWVEEARIQVFDDAAWSEPTIAHGSFFVRSMGELARVEVRPAADPALAAKRAWIDLDRTGAELPDTRFGRFVRSLETAADRSAAVDEFLAGVDSFPIVEGEWAHFVFRGPQPNVGIAGDMVGERTEFDMLKVPGTDLFYFNSKLPRDARVSYAFFTEPGDDGTVDPLNPRTTYWPREGSEFDREVRTYSVFDMPEATEPAYLKGDPAQEGRIETHVIDFADLDVQVRVPPPFLRFIGQRPTGRRARVYLPAGHDPQRAEPYPVVFVFGGDKALEALDAKRTLDHLLGDELPAVVVVFLDRLYEFMASDSAWSAELHRRTLFERVLPWVQSTYGVGGETYLLGFGYGGPIVLQTAQAPRSASSRIAMVQPFVLDVSRPALVAGVAQVPPERRPAVYLETSRIDLRGAHETWDIAKEQGKVAEHLREHGWPVTRGTNSCGFFWSAWRTRLGPALAFLLTGEAEVPASDGPTARPDP